LTGQKDLRGDRSESYETETTTAQDRFSKVVAYTEMLEEISRTCNNPNLLATQPLQEEKPTDIKRYKID
jgi:hypothetical protein